MTPTLEALERFHHAAMREQVRLLEHEPVRELVAATDIVRTDQLGRRVVACPAGQPPAQWLVLTEQERHALVEPTPPPKDGTLQAGHCGFTPLNTVVGWTIERAA